MKSVLLATEHEKDKPYKLLDVLYLQSGEIISFSDFGFVPRVRVIPMFYAFYVIYFVVTFRAVICMSAIKCQD